MVDFRMEAHGLQFLPQPFELSICGVLAEFQAVVQKELKEAEKKADGEAGKAEEAKKAFAEKRKADFSDFR